MKGVGVLIVELCNAFPSAFDEPWKIAMLDICLVLDLSRVGTRVGGMGSCVASLDLENAVRTPMPAFLPNLAGSPQTGLSGPRHGGGMMLLIEFQIILFSIGWTSESATTQRRTFTEPILKGDWRIVWPFFWRQFDHEYFETDLIGYWASFSSASVPTKGRGRI
ncbi:hypothetical protein B0H14DRAFT_2596016 [Mycena olivaceomarginata]|nr:hypothetical protein B0H14DRAFT_2596016 [Mycena olivaceomarginata]